MANSILHKRSAVPSRAPTTADLAVGEFGVNSYDGKVFFKKDDGTPIIKEIANVDTTATAIQGSNADNHRIDVQTYGFLNQTETTIAFDGTSTFTLAPVGATWSYYRAGIRYTITGSKTATIPAGTGTNVTYFIFIDATDGTLSVSTSAWTLADTKVPVATICRNSGMTPSFLMGEERHTIRFPRHIHLYLHSSRGTAYASGGALTGPTVGSSTNSAKTCAVTAANIFDEDIYNTSSAITAGNGSTDAFYSMVYRTAAATWAWARSVMPFKYAGVAAIQYDLNGVMTAAGAGGGGATRYVNYYMLCTNIQGQESIVWVAGRSAFTSAALAYAESFANFDMSGFPGIEAATVWQFTWDTNGTGLGLCRLNRAPVKVSANILLSTGAIAGTHDGLAGLQGGALGEYYHLTLAQAAAVTGATLPIAISTQAVTFNTYVFTASLTLTLPLAPVAGDWVDFSDRSGFTTCVIARNSQNIMGVAEDMTLDNTNGSGKLVFVDATRGWVFV